MSSNMIEQVKISELSPAAYNPRKLADDAQENLKKSLTTLGVIKAIVIRKDDKRILAGHQRTKTMKLLGITECPAFQLENVSEYDEVRFNQLHNFTEVEITENQPLLRVNVPKGTVGFVEIAPRDIKMVNKGGEASKVIMLTELISKYGQFANAVCVTQRETLSYHRFTLRPLNYYTSHCLYMYFPKGSMERQNSTFRSSMVHLTMTISRETPTSSQRRRYCETLKKRSKRFTKAPFIANWSFRLSKERNTYGY